MTQKPYSSSPTLPGGSISQGSFGASEGNESLTEHAKQKAIETAGQAKEQLGGALDSGKDRALMGLGGVAEALRQTTRTMREGEGGQLAPYVERAADQLDRVTGYLRNRSVTDLVDDVERYARREPAMFLGGAFALGLLAGRFLKASGRNRYEARYGRGERYEGRYGGYDRDEAMIERDTSGYGPSYGAGRYEQTSGIGVSSNIGSNMGSGMGTTAPMRTGSGLGTSGTSSTGIGSGVGAGTGVGPSSVGFGTTSPGIGPTTKPMQGAGAGSSGSLDSELSRTTLPTGNTPPVSGGTAVGGGSTPGLEPKSPPGRISGGNRSV